MGLLMVDDRPTPEMRRVLEAQGFKFPMIDMTAAPKRIQELMDDGLALQDALEEASLVGITINVWWEVNLAELGWADQLGPEHFPDDRMMLEFYHKESGTRWLAKFSGYDAEEVEVFGPVHSWVS